MNILLKFVFQFKLDNRYMIFQSGELHISQVDQMDSQLHYRCQTRNKLTGELKQSTNAGRLIITGKIIRI